MSYTGDVYKLGVDPTAATIAAGTAQAAAFRQAIIANGNGERLVIGKTTGDNLDIVAKSRLVDGKPAGDQPNGKSPNRSYDSIMVPVVMADGSTSFNRVEVNYTYHPDLTDAQIQELTSLAQQLTSFASHATKLQDGVRS
jgi:hypothetical protein